jgi:hypothetical protein
LKHPIDQVSASLLTTITLVVENQHQIPGPSSYTSLHVLEISHIDNMLRLLSLPAALAILLSSTVTALALPTEYNSLEARNGDLTIALPSSGLPAPSTLSPQVSLKYIALGVGTQNYTCASTPNSATAAPVQVGAKAVLFDAGQFFQKLPIMINKLPPLSLGLYTMTGQPDMTSITGGAVLGDHYFNAAGQPVFDLTKVGAKLTAKKLANVAAPADACAGPRNAGAVDWLLLTDVGGGASYGCLSHVYRVVTAGGNKPATCAGKTGTFEVPYTTEYWYYGP